MPPVADLLTWPLEALVMCLEVALVIQLVVDLGAGHLRQKLSKTHFMVKLWRKRTSERSNGAIEGLDKFIGWFYLKMRGYN